MTFSPFRFPLVVLIAVGLLSVATPPVDAHDTDPDDFLFTFTGGGWGHGVGMSQYGALGRADAGHTFDEILTFYYDGTSVVTDADLVPDTMRVRLARPSTETITPASTMTVTIDGIVGPTELTEPLTVGRVTPGAVDSPWSVTTPSLSLCEACGDETTIITVDFPQGSSADTVTVASTGRAYGRGQIQIRSSGLADDMWVVVGDMTMDEFLYGLGEVPSSWPDEALKAQATAARSYATAKTNERSHDGLCACLDGFFGRTEVQPLVRSNLHFHDSPSRAYSSPRHPLPAWSYRQACTIVKRLYCHRRLSAKNLSHVEIQFCLL